jgi:hypothetical protein
MVTRHDSVTVRKRQVRVTCEPCRGYTIELPVSPLAVVGWEPVCAKGTEQASTA